MLENFAVYGDAEHVLEKVIELEKSGVTHVCFGHPLGRGPVKIDKTTDLESYPPPNRIKTLRV